MHQHQADHRSSHGSSWRWTYFPVGLLTVVAVANLSDRTDAWSIGSIGAFDLIGLASAAALLILGFSARRRDDATLRTVYSIAVLVGAFVMLLSASYAVDQGRAVLAIAACAMGVVTLGVEIGVTLRSPESSSRRRHG